MKKLFLLLILCSSCIYANNTEKLVKAIQFSDFEKIKVLYQEDFSLIGIRIHASMDGGLSVSLKGYPILDFSNYVMNFHKKSPHSDCYKKAHIMHCFLTVWFNQYQEYVSLILPPIDESRCRGKDFKLEPLKNVVPY